MDCSIYIWVYDNLTLLQEKEEHVFYVCATEEPFLILSLQIRKVCCKGRLTSFSKIAKIIIINKVSTILCITLNRKKFITRMQI